MLHSLPARGWEKVLRSVVAGAEYDDTIEIHSPSIRSVVEMTIDRICPEKKLVVVVKKQ